MIMLLKMYLNIFIHLQLLFRGASILSLKWLTIELNCGEVNRRIPTANQYVYVERVKHLRWICLFNVLLHHAMLSKGQLKGLSSLFAYW